jgi:hypothetical protein
VIVLPVGAVDVLASTETRKPLGVATKEGVGARGSAATVITGSEEVVDSPSSSTTVTVGWYSPAWA